MGYYVRALPSKKSNPKWKVQFISKKKEYTKTSAAQFPSKAWDIHQDGWSSLGFFKSMTIEEARDIAKGLNAKEKIKRQEEQYKKYQLKVSEEQLRTAAFLPDEFVAEFEHSFLRTRDSETTKKIRKTPRAQIIWRASQKMLRETGLSPSEWFENQRTFYDWLYLSVWFGLRPKEVDSLKDPNHRKIELLQTGRQVLWVYQTKIISLPPEDRWKLIPIIYDEQKFGLRIVESQNFERPLVKTVKRHLEPDINLYGGREGFTDLMLEKGHRIEAISQWMGHSSIDRTWRSYKQRKGIKFSL